MEEQGVNILYIALGQLKWFERDQPDTPRYAPLVLVPVELHRDSVADRFHLHWREEDIEENLSLEAKLKADFGITLPEFPSEEDFSVDRYCTAVAQALTGTKGWEVLPNAIVLGFFSFAKFLMYRDLDAANWPDGEKLLRDPFLTALLQDGFPPAEPVFPDDAQLDTLIPAARLDHIVDSDSSQTQAVELVRQGRSVVIQGPPGTGKSQSITNIIAAAVLDGKRVLFVAEKLAALEVVKRRLEREGLGPLCLELHSNKANKRAVIEEIGRTWKLGRPRQSDLEALVPKLEESRTVLNRHVASLHERLSPSGLSAFVIVGRLTALGERGAEASGLVFAGAESWTTEQCAERRRLVEELVERISEIGSPAQHPWRGACRETVLRIDLEPLAARIRTLRDRLTAMRDTSQSLATTISQRPPATLALTEDQRVIAGFVASAPPLDKPALCQGVWSAGLTGLRDLVASGRLYAETMAALGSRVTPTTWEQDFSGVRSNIAAHGKSWLRFLNGNYRRSLAELRGALTGELPGGFTERLALIDQIVAGQRALRAVREADGQSAFGALWQREKSDWAKLEAVVSWVSRQAEAGLDESFRRMFVGVQDQTLVGRLAEQLAGQLAGVREAAAQVASELALDCGVAFGTAKIEDVPLDALVQRCGAWLADMESLSKWNSYFVRARRSRELGLGPLVDRMEQGSVPALDCFDRVYFSQMLREVARLKPELMQFDGVLHERRITEFRQLDRDRLTLAKLRTLLAHSQRMPASNSGVGATGLVKSEMERKRGHRSVRRLLKDAGSVVQAIKPVFMMSPLSVAQYLEPGAIEFDLLVVDEASQVQPVDALGAIARCKQIVVVGDSKQLPPTRFFARLTSETTEDEEAESQAAEAKDIESILGLCCARGLPQTMLRWHYRSRHQSLIAVSNHEFYEDRLVIIPSPYSAAAGLGLKFNHIPEGVFDSGASGTNRVEAKAVCRAVIEHARRTPELSLGVAAFSVRQQQAILDELELLRREHPETEPFFNDHATEPFFVKNLENVQGDERDVIFISVGYGRDVRGFLAMRFGPLSNEGGERRLNVLISRAKKRCEVFSSITADEIDLERASGRGVQALKTFLGFAQTGRLDVAAAAGREEQSAFEEAVRKAVESLGYEVHAQVGIAGCFIDLAVVDREREGRYLLGIECDGAAYHASRSARDRDRLRQAVLEDHGWIIHRIWSADWFQRPAEQLRKVAEAIERAKAALAEKPPPPSVKVEETIERETTLAVDAGGLNALSTPYKMARLAVPRNRDPHELSTRELADLLFMVVEDEGPIHEDELVVRVRDLWNLQRAGSRVQDAVARGVRSLLVTQRCVREDGFLSLPGAVVPVRNREDVDSATLRKPDMLPPSEIRGAILALIDTHHGATLEETPIAVARILGFKTTSGPLRAVIEAQIARLVQLGAIQETEGMLRRAVTA
jgi:very-short-patch-repair endonuclease